jgi:hypothetical protein
MDPYTSLLEPEVICRAAVEGSRLLFLALPTRPTVDFNSGGGSPRAGAMFCCLAIALLQYRNRLIRETGDVGIADCIFP